MSELLLNKSKTVVIAGETFEIKRLTYANKLKMIGLMKGCVDEKGNISFSGKEEALKVSENMTELFAMILGKDTKWVEANVYQEDADELFKTINELNAVPLSKGDQAPA